MAQVIRAKVNAILIGVTGIGIYNQLNTFASRATQFSQLRVNEALVKQIAETKFHETKFHLIYSSIKAYILIVSFLLLLSISCLVIFRQSISVYLLGDNHDYRYYFLAVASIPILIINSLFFAILKGFRDIKNISKATLFATFTNLAIFLPLAFKFRLDGVILTIPTMYIVIAAWNYYFLRKHILRPHHITILKIFNSKIQRYSLKEMFVFSGFGMSISVLILGSEFFIRGLVVNDLGMDKLGLYVPIIAWTGLYTGIILNSFNTYLFPRLCETSEKDETNGILNDSIRIATIMLIPFVLLLISFKKELITIFYSNEFSETTLYLPLHFFGLIWHVWFIIFGQAMTPKGFIKQHGIFYGSSMIFDMLIVYIFISKLDIGLYGWMLKYVITPFILFNIYRTFLKKKIGFYLFAENKKLMIFLVLITAITILIDRFSGIDWLTYIIGPVFVLSSYLLLKENEKAFLWEKGSLLVRKVTNRKMRN